MKLALLFAGQGAQHAGMGADLYEQFPAFRQVLDECAAGVEFDLKSLCFAGPDETLNQTRYTQPCMVAFAAGVTRVLQEAGAQPVAAAGLSLGEYSALCAAGVFSPRQAVELAAFRGAAMEQAVQGRASGMAAVLGLDRKTLADACAGASALGVVEIANYNCPGQMAIAGDAAAVERACELAKQAGARRCVPLKVSGPFHTSLMAPAASALAERFTREPFGKMNFPVYFNCLGGPMGDGDTVPALLEKQVRSSVYMEDTLRRLADEGIDRVIEIGPGRVLSGLWKKTVTARKVLVLGVETAQELAEAVRMLQEEN